MSWEVIEGDCLEVMRGVEAEYAEIARARITHAAKEMEGVLL